MINLNRYFLFATSSAVALSAMPVTAMAQDSTPDTAEIGVQEQEDPATNQIVVSGIRRSLESAQSVKQDSDQIIDSVVAEDIGKLPDVTASESLARIPGVTVTRDAGVAQGVRIRGLPDLATTYNGREVFTAEGRFVQLQDFPSNSIARIDVYKSASADLLEAGLAGLVDVKSRKPFDFKGTRVTGYLGGVHWYQSQRLGIEANGLASTRWKTGIGEMGFLIEGSYADTKYIDSSRAVAQDIRNRTNITGYPQLRYPNFVNTDYASATRWRPNVDAAFQWRPSSTLEIYLDGLYQGYRGRGDGHNLQVVSGDLATLTNITLIPGTNQAASFDAAVGTGAAPTGAQQINDQSTDTYQAGGGFIWKNGRLKLTGDVAYTESTFINRNVAFNYTLTSSPARHFEFDTSEGVGGGTVNLINYDLYNLGNYRWTGLTQSGNRGHGQSWQGRLDLDYKLDNFILTNLQAGLRFSNRDADSYSYAQSTYAAPAGQTYSVLASMLNIQPAAGGFRNDSAASIRTWLSPTRESLIANLDTLRSMTTLTVNGVTTTLAKGDPTWGSPVYTSNEKLYTGYVQARYAFEIAGVPFDGLIGVRATQADVAINGLRRSTTGTGATAVTTVTPISTSSSNSDFLPNVSMRIKLDPKLQMRIAYTETRTRPGFGQLNPTITIGALPTGNTCADPNGADCIRSASSGNPDLKPTTSKNYDASVEYYFSRSGALTIGGFYKDVNGFINTFTTDVADAEFGRLRMSQPQNGGAGRIKGIEAGVRSFLRAPWLPDWMSNFGGMVNYTYLDAKSVLAPSLAATLPGLQRIAGTSKHTINTSAWYENKVLSLRLSYNWRSDFIDSYGQVADPALGNPAPLGPTLPITVDARGTMDFAATLQPTDNITLSFNVNNLAGGAYRNYRTFNAAGQAYAWQTRFLESVYRAGIRFRF
ncbi:TonB-dependent receptor [Sphingomonas sp. OTU376]|uniref:TonB-dependent receptor n=1 Tax=Sphingomonas sp. OTU376 TaxID=3043863 RepID=UPI00313D4C22